MGQGKSADPPYLNRESVEEDAERYLTVALKGSCCSADSGSSFQLTVATTERRVSKAFTLRAQERFAHYADGPYPKATTQRALFCTRHGEQCGNRRRGGRIIAGTTSTRTLESAVRLTVAFAHAGERLTSFIRPGDSFGWWTVLTNFHLPESLC